MEKHKNKIEHSTEHRHRHSNEIKHSHKDGHKAAHRKTRKRIKTIKLGIIAFFLVVLTFILIIFGIGYIRNIIDKQLKQTLLINFQNNAVPLAVPPFKGKMPVAVKKEEKKPSAQSQRPVQLENKKPKQEPLPPKTHIDTSGLIYAGFSDLFSGIGWINQEKTTMYQDRITTAFTFPPKYTWKKINPSSSIKSKLSSITNKKASIGNKTLSINSNLLFFNGAKINLPNEIRNLDIDNISVASLDTKWAVGIVVKINGGYEGYVYTFDGSSFSKILGGNKNIFISQYKGTFGLGGTDSDWLAVYGAYRGIGVHIRNGKVEDISRLFDYRIMNGGFIPMVIRTTFNSSTSPVWFIYSLTPKNPKLIKLYQNDTDKIQGSVDFTQNTIGNSNKAVFTQDGNKLIGKINNQNGINFYKFEDFGFDKSKSLSIESVNISNYPAEIKVGGFYRMDIATQGADVKFYLSNDGNNWVETPIKQKIKFPNQSGRRIYWKANFVPDNNPTASPFFDFIGIEYYVKFL